MRSVYNPKNGHEIKTDLTDEQAVAICREGDKFARDLASKYPNISDCQYYWLIRKATDTKPPHELPAGTVARLDVLFKCAYAHGLKFPAMRFVTEAGTLRLYHYRDKYWFKCGERRMGCVNEDDTYTGEWHELIPLICASPLAMAIEHGKKMGSCCFCKHQLTDPRSVAMGYGPICADKWGLPWGLTVDGSEVFHANENV